MVSSSTAASRLSLLHSEPRHSSREHKQFAELKAAGFSEFNEVGGWNILFHGEGHSSACISQKGTWS